MNRMICRMTVICCFAMACAFGWSQETQTTVFQQYGFGSLSCAAYSPNPARPFVVTGGSSGAVIWNIETAQPIRFLRAPGHPVDSVAISPDGTKVLTGGGWPDNTVRLWDSSTGILIRTFEGHSFWVSSVVFSPDGTRILTGSGDLTAKLWEMETGDLIRTFEVHTGYLTSVAFSPDGTKILTGSWDTTARLWDATTGDLIRTFEGYTYVNSVAFSPDGTQVLTGSSNAQLWNAATGDPIRSFDGVSAAFSPDGTKVLTGTSSYSVILWDTVTGFEIWRFEGHTGDIGSLAFSPDGTKLMTASDDNSAVLLDSATGDEIRTFEGHGSPIHSVAFSPDGMKVLTGSSRQTSSAPLDTKLWDAGTAKEVLAIDGSAPCIFSPDGMQLLTSSKEDTLRLWSAETGNLIRAFEEEGGFWTSAAFSPDGTRVLTGSQDWNAYLWDVATGNLIRKFEGHTSWVNSVAYSPDGTKILTGGHDDYTAAKLWDVATGTQIRTFETQYVTSVAFSADGTKVLTGSTDSTAKLWNAATGDLIRTLVGHGHGNDVTSVAFSPDGTKALTGSWDLTAKLWDVASGDLIRTFEGLTGRINAVAFSPDGTMIITGREDGQTLLWEVNPPRAIIVAGGGAYASNSIAQQTNDLGAYAYQTLKRRGYEAQDILYLTAFGPTDPLDPTKPFRDADGDGLNDVDGWSTLNNLAQIQTFAQGAGRLMVILIDHGFVTNNGCYFQMNPTQVLPASTLDNWLDNLQSSYGVDVTLVVDACYSGGFVEACKGGVGGKKRIVISSTTSNNVAVFLPPPDMTSFLHTFLGSAYMGNSMGEAWRAGKQFFEEFPVAGQIPQLDDDSGSTTAADIEFFGASWAYGVQSTQDVNDFFPVFDTWTSDGVVAPGTPVTLWARTLSGQNPLGVVAVVRPPAPSTISGDAVTNLPHVALVNSSTDTRMWYATTTDVFTSTGQHVISFTARMPYERRSNPVYSRITVSAGTDTDITPIRAILAVDNTPNADLYESFSKLGPYAYSVYLDRFQDSGGVHHPEWIGYYINPFIHSESDGSPSSSAVLNAIDAVGSDIGRLYVHLIGDSPGAGSIEMANGDYLSAADLDAKLDAFQVRSVTGTVILIVDCPYSGSFLSTCKATGSQKRVLMTSGRATDSALFSKSGQAVSFSQKLLASAYQGNHLRNGFRSGVNFLLTFLLGGIEPQLDDNGDGVYDLKTDGVLAQTLFLGRRYAYAGGEASDLPFVLNVTPAKVNASGGSSVGFSAELMEGVEPSRVFAQVVAAGVGSVTEPLTTLPEFDFVRDGTELWSWSGDVTVPAADGSYTVAVYASYPDGATQEKISNPKFATILHPDADDYEVDDTPAQASLLISGWTGPQHNFHQTGDPDWAKFFVKESLAEGYTIRVSNCGAMCDAVLDLYSEDDLETSLPTFPRDFSGYGEQESATVLLSGPKWYYVLVTSYDPSDTGEGTEYSLSVSRDSGVSNGRILEQHPTSLLVGWDPSPGEVAYSVVKSAMSQNVMLSDFSGTESVPGGTTEFLVEGLSPDTTYYFYVEEYDSLGSTTGLSTSFEGKTLTVDASVTIISTTPTTSQKLTTGDPYDLSAVANCLSQLDDLRLQWSLWNNSGVLQTKPAEFLANSLEWQEKSTTFNGFEVPNNGPVVLRARILNASPTPTVLAEHTVSFQISTPTPMPTHTPTPTATPTLSTGVLLWKDYE